MSRGNLEHTIEALQRQIESAERGESQNVTVNDYYAIQAALVFLRWSNGELTSEQANNALAAIR